MAERGVKGEKKGAGTPGPLGGAGGAGGDRQRRGKKCSVEAPGILISISRFWWSQRR